MSFARKIILENWGFKLTAILLSSILWLLVRGESTAERIINIPLEIQLPRNMEITSDRPSAVDVTVRGATGNTWFNAPVPTCLIDLQDEGEGLHVVQLSENNVRMPRTSGLEIVAVRPTRITLYLERTVTKDVPIRPLHGMPAEGLDVYRISLTPSSVRISGPRSHINPIQEIPTETIGLSGRSESFSALANLDIKDPSVHASPAGPIEAKVELGVHRRLRSLRPIPVVLNSKDWTANPPAVTVNVLAPANRAGTLTPADFLATAAVDTLDASIRTANLKPEIKLKDKDDPSIVIKEVKPAQITVRRVR
jgi:YbbR domain-containing protein